MPQSPPNLPPAKHPVNNENDKTSFLKAIAETESAHFYTHKYVYLDLYVSLLF